MAMLVGLLFGLPSLRIKGFYLAVATLAAQFFLEWAFAREMVHQLRAIRLGGGRAGRGFRHPDRHAGQDLHPGADDGGGAHARRQEPGAAASAGCGWRCATWTSRPRSSASGRCMPSCRPCGPPSISASPARCGLLRLGSWEPLAFDVNRSFQVLFMIIIGGLGTLLGSFLGAAFIVLVPIFLNQLPSWLGIPLSTAMISHLEFMLFGSMIVFFLIVEPHGLARLWATAKEKLRLWPSRTEAVSGESRPGLVPGGRRWAA